VLRAPFFAERAKNWVTPGNHNHLRITRVLKSLRLLGLEPETAGFFECLAFLAISGAWLKRRSLLRRVFID